MPTPPPWGISELLKPNLVPSTLIERNIKMTIQYSDRVQYKKHQFSCIPGSESGFKSSGIEKIWQTFVWGLTPTHANPHIWPWPVTAPPTLMYDLDHTNFTHPHTCMALTHTNSPQPQVWPWSIPTPPPHVWPWPMPTPPNPKYGLITQTLQLPYQVQGAKA